MKQKFRIEIELPDNWYLQKTTLKQMIENKTILKVNKIQTITKKDELEIQKIPKKLTHKQKEEEYYRIQEQTSKTPQ